jgi:hypothetical protein
LYLVFKDGVLYCNLASQLTELPCIMYKDKYILINNKVYAIF